MNEAIQPKANAGRLLPGWLTATLLLLLALALPADEQPQVGRPGPGTHTRSLRVGDRDRKYRIYIPKSYNDDKATPVVLVFHGGGGDPDGMMKLCGMNAKAELAGFIVVYPFGTGRFGDRLLSFNGGECCGYALDNKAADGMRVTRKTWTGGRKGSEVVLIEIEGGGHTWPGQRPVVARLGDSTMDISANDLMWEFFQRHPRTGAGQTQQKATP